VYVWGVNRDYSIGMAGESEEFSHEIELLIVVRTIHLEVSSEIVSAESGCDDSLTALRVSLKDVFRVNHGEGGLNLWYEFEMPFRKFVFLFF
jgi:hypothetical protein